MHPETDKALGNGDPDIDRDKVVKLVYKLKYGEVASAAAEIERQNRSCKIYGEVAQLVRAPDS